MNVMKMGVCVPTLNAGPEFTDWLRRVRVALPETSRLLVIDSSSEDATAQLGHEANAEVVVIPRAEFNHGGTRNLALERLDDCELVVFLTQDALIMDDATLRVLAAAFSDSRVGAAFGRQLPHADATPVAAHARLFNYPPASRVVGASDIPHLGLKAAFLSNSFAAYRRQALLDAGGFPDDVILSEDMLAGARLLQHGWKLAYCAEARVFHSHNYSLVEEFRRYFDIGVLHARERWLLERLGTAEGEGMRFVRSEVGYLLREAPWRLPEAGLRTLLKYAGYRLGQAEARLPLAMKHRLSMHRRYWR